MLLPQYYSQCYPPLPLPGYAYL